MYWQVYLHKTVVAAEQLLIEILRRARELSVSEEELPGSPSLLFFLKNSIAASSLSSRDVLNKFTGLDDTDVMSAIKQWQSSDDKILSLLCKMLTERRLPKIVLSPVPFDGTTFENVMNETAAGGMERELLPYFVKTGEVENRGYNRDEEDIKILSKEGGISDIYNISDMLSARAFSQITKKYFLCTPKTNY